MTIMHRDVNAAQTNLLRKASGAKGHGVILNGAPAEKVAKAHFKALALEDEAYEWASLGH